MDLEDLIRKLRDSGLDNDELDRLIRKLDGLKDKLDGGSDGIDIDRYAGDLGKILRAFLAGSTGADAQVIGALLQIFGPVLATSLDDIVGRLTRRDADGFDVSRPGPSPTRRKLINRNGPGFKEDRAPDIFLLETPIPVCEMAGQTISVPFRLRVFNREEPIEFVSVIGYDPTGNVAVTASTVFAGGGGIDAKDKQDEDEFFDITVEATVPCATAAALRTIIFQYAVHDEDGNYCFDVISVEFRDLLLDKASKCCGTVRDDDICDAIREGIGKGGSLYDPGASRGITDDGAKKDGAAAPGGAAGGATGAAQPPRAAGVAEFAAGLPVAGLREAFGAGALTLPR